MEKTKIKNILDRHGQWKCREEECIGKCQIRNNRIIVWKKFLSIYIMQILDYFRTQCQLHSKS
jgi:hypothetical protein